MSDLPSIPVERSPSPRLGRVVVFLFAGVLLIAGVREGFRYTKLHLALRNAHREFSKSQFMRAEFWAERAVSADESNVEAMRLMAEIGEVLDKPAALAWRMRVAQRAPGNTADVMAWAKSALRFGHREMTDRALQSLPADFKNRSAGYHELMAGCALADHKPAISAEEFMKAAEIDPSNPFYRVNVEAFQLTNSSSQETRATATRELESAMTDPRVSLFVTRTLLYDALQSGDHARALRFAGKLRSLPERSFSDDLSCLEAMMSESSFHSALEETEHRAGSNLQWAIEMGDWLNSHTMAAETLRWVAQLPEVIRSNIRVQMTAAESYSAVYDWNGLAIFLTKCQWGDGEYLRRAMLIRCKRELGQPWEKEWEQLVSDVEITPPDSLLLAQLVTGWKWRDETIELLWGATTKPQTQTTALQYLWGLYSQTNDTNKLWRVATEQIKIDPSNPAKKNNEAFLSLLLYGTSERSERLAREASTKDPKVPEWAATYAYALHLAGKETEAKNVMENLSPEALGRPGIALYYAIVLAANGDNIRAREMLAKLNPAGMLPEEQKLAADLTRQLNVASR
ncbi:MAG: hypothetical protein WCD79_03930 [Chthoniobacteraceae bacterium]